MAKQRAGVWLSMDSPRPTLMEAPADPHPRDSTRCPPCKLPQTESRTDPDNNEASRIVRKAKARRLLMEAQPQEPSEAAVGGGWWASGMRSVSLHCANARFARQGPPRKSNTKKSGLTARVTAENDYAPCAPTTTGASPSPSRRPLLLVAAALAEEVRRRLAEPVAVSGVAIFHGWDGRPRQDSRRARSLAARSFASSVKVGG